MHHLLHASSIFVVKFLSIAFSGGLINKKESLCSTVCRWNISFLLEVAFHEVSSDNINSCLLPFLFFLEVSQSRLQIAEFLVHLLFIYLFLAVLGLHFCAWASSSCGKRGPLFIAVRGPLTIAASLVAEHRLQTRRLSSCGSRAQLLRGMWDLPRPGLEPVSPALAGGFLTTAPPGKPSLFLLTRSYAKHFMCIFIYLFIYYFF